MISNSEQSARLNEGFSRLTRHSAVTECGLVIKFIGSNMFEMKPKVISVKDRGGSSKRSRLSHFQDSRLTYGAEAISLIFRPLFTARNIPDACFY
jgi:hypothetical protein